MLSRYLPTHDFAKRYLSAFLHETKFFEFLDE